MEIFNFTLSTNPPVIAFFSVHLPGYKMYLHKLKLIRSKKGHIFISYPSYVEDREGKKVYFPFVDFEIEKKKEFEQKVLEIIKLNHGID